MHRRTGWGGGGGQSLGNSDILGGKRNLGKASFKRSLCVLEKIHQGESGRLMSDFAHLSQ